MKTPRYYSIRLYGLGAFPKFIDSLKNMETVNRWIRMAKDDGYIMAEVYRDMPKVIGYFGVERELIKTLELTK